MSDGKRPLECDVAPIHLPRARGRRKEPGIFEDQVCALFPKWLAGCEVESVNAGSRVQVHLDGLAAVGKCICPEGKPSEDDVLRRPVPQHDDAAQEGGAD